MAKNYLGIDLGTTESTVSVIEIENRKDKPIEKLRTLDIYQYNTAHQLDKNIKGLQSSIYIDNDNETVYTGEYAKGIYASGNKPLHTIRSIKTRIGGESMIDVPSQNKGNQSYNMTELSATLLKTIKQSVDKQITGSLEGVTITIPAGFDSDERNATIEAAKLVGFNDIHLLDEPTAVLLNILNSEDSIGELSKNFFEKPKNIIVYDIGGGTLDISISRVEDIDGDFDVDVIERSPRMEFGGDDIDKAIAAYFLQEFEKLNAPLNTRTTQEQAQIVSRIVSNAEKHKIEFNKKVEKTLGNERRKERVKESVNFEIIDNLKISDLNLTDALLKDILSPIISKNGNLTKPLDMILKSSKLTKDAIDVVILTGGSGKFYLVSETLENYFNGTHIIDFTEQNAVSKGASIHTFNQDEEDLKKINIKDIMSDSIYLKRKKGFDLLIQHDQKVGTSGVYKFIFEETLDRLEIFLFYGADNEEEWKYREIAGVFYGLPQTYKKGESIDLEWEFDENKILTLSFEGKELVSSQDSKQQKSNLITNFEIKG
ncbi:MAG: Hsp70 family protein [Sulfurovum sp.]|nr:Hsp70 family protein [Sulfurovaceae bacterium]